MAVCWADCLGDCSAKQSREHLVTESFFPEGVVDVHGFEWCKDEPVRVGIASVTAKILCTAHNNGLSPVDVGGKEAFDAFASCERLASIRQRIKPCMWRVKEYRADGLLFERWCLKTLINICCQRGHAIGRDSAVEGYPSSRLVRIVFGEENFRNRAGLYWATRKGMSINSQDTVQFGPLFKNNLNVEAGIFSFRGWTFLLYLEDEGPPEPLSGIYVNGEDLGDSVLAFHGKQLNFKIGRFVSHRMKFDWQ
jgi:hypothetical protein